VSEKKVVSRKIALEIEVACIALLIIIGGIVVDYTSALNNKDAQIKNDQSKIGMLQNQNANLQRQLLSDNLTISSYNSTINSLKTEISSLQTQVTSINSKIVQLQNQLLSNSSTVSSLQNQLRSDKSEINSTNTEMANLQDQISLLNNVGFCIIQITDTQFLTDPRYLGDSVPNLFNGLTSWIVDSSRAFNVVMVVHTGDIVQVANNMSDWSNANNAMMQLYNNGVPYCWNAGNHDQLNKTREAGGGNPNGSWLGGNYPAFNVTAMRQQPYWVGDISDGKNTAVQFTYDNYHFMIINIEYNANSTVLGWMQTLIKCNPNVNVIVATHNFLNGHGKYGGNRNPNGIAWATNFENLLNNYPNVFMTLNGHDENDGGSAYNKRVGNREEIFFNMQDNDSNQGAANARIYAFDVSDPANPVVNVYTYQTFGTPQYLTDPADQFSFSTSLTAYSFSTVSTAANTNFWVANDHSVSFNYSTTLNGFSQYGDALTFENLTLNGVTSNFTVTAIGANIVISNYDPNSIISYAVSGFGSQTFSVNKSPTSVDIDGIPASTGWSYSNGEITVTGATSSVAMNFS
jgi:hypothetical protein